MGRETGGGIGMGNTCKSMVDSCQCMAKKPLQYDKVISLQLIKINGKKTTTLFLVYFVKLPLSCLHGKAQKLLNFVAVESRFVWRRSEIVLPCKGALWKSGGGCFWFLI